MTTYYITYHQHLEDGLAQLGQEISNPMNGFARLHKKSVEDGTLDSKTKELMSLAFSIVMHCESFIAYQVHDTIATGATHQEFLETIGVTLMMGGGPGSIYAVHALDAIDQFQPEGKHAKKPSS